MGFVELFDRMSFVSYQPNQILTVSLSILNLIIPFQLKFYSCFTHPFAVNADFEVSFFPTYIRAREDQNIVASRPEYSCKQQNIVFPLLSLIPQPPVTSAPLCSLPSTQPKREQSVKGHVLHLNNS
jgi:hypothetical protein